MDPGSAAAGSKGDDGVTELTLSIEGARPENVPLSLSRIQDGPRLYLGSSREYDIHTAGNGIRIAERFRRFLQKLAARLRLPGFRRGASASVIVLLF